MPKLYYFDYAAATPLAPEAIKAVQDFEQRFGFYNPSAMYAPARRLKQAYEASRSQVAKVLGAKSSEIIFCAGATESINLAIQGVGRRNGGKIIVSAIEHEAVIASARATAETLICPVKPSGLIDMDKLAKLIDDQTVLVSIGYANNEIGVIQPLSKIAKIVAGKRNQRHSKLPLYFHSDASQAANYLPLPVNRLGVDLLSLNGGKIYGPARTGCLYIKNGVILEPLFYGGGQEQGLLSGTENAPATIGFARALELAQAERKLESHRLGQLRDYLLKSLVAKIADLKLNGELKPRLPNNLNLQISGVNGETLVHHLDAAGILAATGAACSANQNRPSAVLKAIGLPLAKINSSLRLSLGKLTTRAEVDYLIKHLPRIVARLR